MYPGKANEYLCTVGHLQGYTGTFFDAKGFKSVRQAIGFRFHFYICAPFPLKVKHIMFAEHPDVVIQKTC
jgi:hypothetical protein